MWPPFPPPILIPANIFFHPASPKNMLHHQILTDFKIFQLNGWHVDFFYFGVFPPTLGSSWVHRSLLRIFLVQFSVLVPLHSCQTFGRTSLTIWSKYATEMGDGRMRDDRIDHQRKKQNAPWVKIVPFSQNYHQPKWKLLRNNNHNGYALWNHWEWSVFRLLFTPQ